MKKLLNVKHCTLLVVFFVAFLVFYLAFIEDNDESVTEDARFEYGNILSAKVQPSDGANVFFIETGDETVNVSLTARQACAVESAAMTNPHLKIFLVYSSRDRLRNLKVTEEFKSILSYPNVHINYLNKVEFSEGTPMDEFMRSGKLEKSKFRVVHTSDAIRLLILWKYGGSYLDTDMIVQKKLDSVPSNFACLQSSDEINNAFLNFDQNAGRGLVEHFIDDFVKNFDGKSFISNGPILVTRVLKRICETNDMEKIIKMKTCQGFHAIDLSACYKVRWKDWPKFMDEQHGDEIVNFVSESLVVHFWNHDTSTRILKKTSNAAYIKLAKLFCPKVIAAVKETF